MKYLQAILSALALSLAAGLVACSGGSSSTPATASTGNQRICQRRAYIPYRERYRFDYGNSQQRFGEWRGHLELRSQRHLRIVQSHQHRQRHCDHVHCAERRSFGHGHRDLGY